jgi:hypothetical protein
MNPTELKFANLVPENDKKFAVDGIVICCECGSPETTILVCGIYCRSCRSFRLFKEMSRRNYALTGTVLDLD